MSAPLRFPFTRGIFLLLLSAAIAGCGNSAEPPGWTLEEDNKLNQEWEDKMLKEEEARQQRPGR